tara:strand:- start:111 stop:335 length:225 start_codon:yes stop_codon:yes gene_type:complete
VEEVVALALIQVLDLEQEDQILQLLMVLKVAEQMELLIQIVKQILDLQILVVEAGVVVTLLSLVDLAAMVALES